MLSAALGAVLERHLEAAAPADLGLWTLRGLEVLAQTTRGLQDSVMAIRAQPVKSVFSRMPRLARELEPVEEPRRSRRREREDALEQERLLGTAGGEQRAIAAHRVLDVPRPQLLIGGVHQIVRGCERERRRANAEVGRAAAARRVRDLDPGARDLRLHELDIGDRGKPPPGRRHQVPQHRADQIDLDIAQPARVRPLRDPRGVGRAEQGREHAIGEQRAGRRRIGPEARSGVI